MPHPGRQLVPGQLQLVCAQQMQRHLRWFQLQLRLGLPQLSPRYLQVVLRQQVRRVLRWMERGQSGQGIGNDAIGDVGESRVVFCT